MFDLFTKDHLLALAEGDSFSSDGLFLGVSDKPVKWKVLSIAMKEGARTYQFEAKYFHISLGYFQAAVLGDAVDIKAL